MAVDPIWRRLGFTSGRRTYAGNRLVGGVPNSQHLHGTAADFTAPMSDVRAHFGPNVKIIDEGDHRHVQGLSNVPYYGRRGTTGLVNGVDTSAPKGASVPAPRSSAPLPAMQPPAVPKPLYEQYSPAQLREAAAGGGPQTLRDLQNQILNGQGPDVQMEPMSLQGALNPQVAMQAPADPKLTKGGLFGSGLSFGEALVHGLNGYLAGRGNPVGMANMQMLNQHQREETENNEARQRLAMQIQAQREKHLYDAMNPKPTQTDRYIAAIMDPNTPPELKAIYRQVIMRPIGVPTYNADGSAGETKFFYPDQMPGMGGTSASDEDEWEYNN